MDISIALREAINQTIEFSRVRYLVDTPYPSVKQRSLPRVL